MVTTGSPTVGAALVMVIVTGTAADRPPASVALTMTVAVPGPSSSAAENVTFCPGVSNDPSSSRSHA